MIELLTDQSECDKAFRDWAKTLINGSFEQSYGWLIRGTSIAFTNYGHGEPGSISTQVMLGADIKSNSNIVKIVNPDASQGDKGKLTVVGRDEDGRIYLLREGWLKPNKLSRDIRSEFSSLSGINPVPLMTKNGVSKREWYIVADLTLSPLQIVRQTVSFTLACARARAKAGGGASPVNDQPYRLGADEKGHTVKIVLPGGKAEVIKLQGYVWTELQTIIGSDFIKPQNSSFSVDGYIQSLDMLIEIKTGVYAHDIYEAVGQLYLYPSLIGISQNTKRVLLIPDNPPMNAMLSAALRAASIEVFTYCVKSGADKPAIVFSDAFLMRCSRTATAPH